MKPSEARQLLVEQHGRLRELMAAARSTAARLSGAPGADDRATALRNFRSVLMILRELIAKHNSDEETLLEPLLSPAGDIGSKRVARMFEEHTAEHQAFREALSGDDVEVASRIAELAEELDAHMMAEERTFLSPGVLRD